MNRPPIKPGPPTRRGVPLLAASLIFVFLLFGPVSPAPAEGAGGLDAQWGGHIRTIGTLTYPDDRSIYQFAESGRFSDRQGELRINHQLFLGEQWIFEAHYEMVGLQGDTLKNNHRLAAILPQTATGRLTGSGIISDNRRMMNLTHTISDGNDDLLYHRLDRLSLTHTATWGSLRAGRQALTWGNGLLFNPMDLFSPFSPTAVARDYKAGEDMIHLQIPRENCELQLLYLPRRDTATGEIENNQSSFAGKWRRAFDAVELDIMAARHWGDVVLGAGASGYLGGAAWRGDILYTMLDDRSRTSDYWQLVANLDYAWQWGGKNVYGLIEFYYNGLGSDGDYAQSFADPSMGKRIDRGEIFTLGRTYLAGQIQLELHPLMRTHLITIVNLSDPSAVVQPQLAWDMAANLQLILGATFNGGGGGTEFGGFDATVAGNAVKVAPADSRYLWLSYYF